MAHDADWRVRWRAMINSKGVLTMDKHSRRLLLKVGGMHCPNCDVLIERKFKAIPGVLKVRARHSSGKVEIIYYSGELNLPALRQTVEDDGYTVALWQDRHTAPSPEQSAGRHYLETGAAFLVVVGAYIALQQLGVVPDRLSVPNTISYGLAFAIGVVASLSTCMAVTGGLLVAVAARYNAATPDLTPMQRFRPHLFFNAGRLASYSTLGAAIGALGSTLTLSPEANGVLVIAASAVMIVLGLQMLRLVPAGFLPRMPKFFAHRIHSLSERETKGGAFLLGASTFFLPCGFTQALQLYVLAKGSAETGALIMLAFAIGTLPALLSLSAISSFARGAFQRYFLKFAGVTVVLLGIINVQSGLTLTTIGTEASAPERIAAASPQETAAKSAPTINGKQILEMKIVGYNYVPNRFTVEQGIPVEWRIDASQAVGCGRILIAPKAGVRKLLPFGTSVVSFTPQEAGDIRFNCSMGMMTRGSSITVLVSAKSKPAAESVGAPPTFGQPKSLSAEQRAAIERIAKDYLISHPEVIQEALAELERRQQAAQLELHRATVKDNATAIFDSSHQVILGNRQGDVTLVEFFDYNCPYCKHAFADMAALIKADPKLRVVLKEFPVLGENSVEAAKIAVAVRMQDGDGAKYFEFHRRLFEGRGQADRARALAAAKEAGVDMARLERDLASAEVQATINENFKLAEGLGINGTPSYVIGSEVVVGAVGLDELGKKIAAARTPGAVDSQGGVR
jgi:protein-disulfide isomerase/sulfite exporter TauE/SafE/copper chaperone CopZ